MINLVEYGMETVGRNLGLIRENEFESLKRVIREQSEKRFGSAKGYLDDQNIEVILRNAAESLEQSQFFTWRWKDAKDIYQRLGDAEKVKALEGKIKEEEMNESALFLEQNNHIFY